MASNQQVLVIGLGQFGLSLARSLYTTGTEVIGVDRRSERLQAAADYVTEAVGIDATDEEQLAALAPQQRDICVCAIGENGREASIIATALLRQLGAPRLIARATDPLHERILRLVGAHEVVNPERIYGERLASRIAYKGILETLPLGDDLIITELQAPDALVGRTLADLDLSKRHTLTVVAIRRSEGRQGHLVLPGPDVAVRRGDLLVLVGPPGAAQNLAERL